MTRVDQFESVFRASAKEVYTYTPLDLQRILVISDRDAEGTAAFEQDLRRFLGPLSDRVEWRAIGGGDFDSVGVLLDRVQDVEPSLICTHRHLHSEGWRWPHSLGEYLDILTQATPYAVLVAPHRESGRALDHALENNDRVMAVTDHLTGDDRLVNVAVGLTREKGTLFLTHIEDRANFESMMGIISKVPSIDTEMAREDILKQLLHEPTDYIASCAKVLGEQNVDIHIESAVTLGHSIADYRRLIDEHEIDLLVFNTKDDDQLAMHGLAYPLAVELREIPLLML
jgi:hypothetical protein